MDTEAPTPGDDTAGDPYVPGTGNGGYDVTGYDLDLRYRLASNLLEGRARITAVAAHALSRFSLDLSGLRATKVTVDGRPVHWSRRPGKLHITPAAPIGAAVAFAVDVHYTGNPRPVHTRWGEVGWEELDDGLLVASQPCGASSWFPCDDRPSQKAPFRVAVTTASPYRVIANGELVRQRVRGSETTWVYDQPEPMAPYLATLQIGRYVVAADDGPAAQIRVATTRGLLARAQHALVDQRRMLDLFVERFGPYPFPAYTVVVTEEPLEIPFEAQGMSVFGINHLEAEHARLIAHELSHQWFGNSLTPASWCHIWLNEGFACYAEWLWSEHAGDRSAAEQAQAAHQRLARLPQDLVIGDPGPEDMFDDRLYKRGALTLHELRRTVGDEAFFGLLREWCRIHQHATVTTEDLIHLAELRTGHRLRDLFDRWLAAPALPALG